MCTIITVRFHILCIRIRNDVQETCIKYRSAKWLKPEKRRSQDGHGNQKNIITIERRRRKY